jgi:predicted SAM-dependent methyltransferase
MRYLNLGCGKRYHAEWINVDIRPQGSGVIAHDLTKGVPMADDTCDVVYHSNLLEHLRPLDARGLMNECFRVLKPGGILRVAVPDLEQICRMYLTKLESALTGDPAASVDYEWMVIELLDQMVRERSGGKMLNYLNRDNLPNENFIYTRIGEEGRDLVRSLRSSAFHPQDKVLYASQIWHLGRSVVARTVSFLWKGLEDSTLRFFLGSMGLRALQIGRFRMGGEVHRWMYDRYSLNRLLLETGFRNPTVLSAEKSQIPEWSRFNLDMLPDGSVVKPDSLFMEGTKHVKVSHEPQSH